MKLNDGHVTADMYQMGSGDISRWHIKNRKFYDFLHEWDGDWEALNLNENLAIYEEDNRNVLEISGSVTTTVKVADGSTVGGTMGFKKTYKTDDELIAQTNLVRQTFFFFNRVDLEGEMYNGWPVRNKTQNVSFTLHDRTFVPM